MVFTSGKLCCTNATNAKHDIVCLCCDNINGSKAKQIGSSRAEPGELALIRNITSTSCTLDYPMTYECYQYIYRTNEMIPN